MERTWACIRKWKWADPFSGPSGGTDKVSEDHQVISATNEGYKPQPEVDSNTKAELSDAKIDEQALHDALSSVATLGPLLSSQPLPIPNDVQQAVTENLSFIIFSLIIFFS